MPTCRYCHHKFTRWEGLRDHMENQRCSNMDYKGEVIHAASPDSGRPGPNEHIAGTLSHQVRLTASSQQPAEDEGHERSQMRASVRIAVKDVRPKGQSSTLCDSLEHAMPAHNINEIYKLAMYLRWRLRQECGLCGQWVASNKSTKQRYKHSHGQGYNKHHVSALQLCRTFSALGRPCFLWPNTRGGHTPNTDQNQ